jgi:oligosaccharyltransferase complex subunit beta
MLSFLALLLPLLGLAGLLEARSSSGDSVLVVLEPTLPKDDFSIFFKDLEGMGNIMTLGLNLFWSLLAEQGYDLTFRAPKDVTPAIVVDGLPSFSHVILFAPSTKSKISLTQVPTFAWHTFGV